MPRRPVALLAVAAAAAVLAGCGGSDAPPVDEACLSSPDRVEQALARAPAAVTLPSGTRLSDCVSRARTDADLQTTGLVLTRAADHLAGRAQAGDARAPPPPRHPLRAARPRAPRPNRTPAPPAPPPPGAPPG